MSELDEDILVLYRAESRKNEELLRERDKLRNDMLMAETYWAATISALNKLIGRIARDPEAVRALADYEVELKSLSEMIALYLKVSSALGLVSAGARL